MHDGGDELTITRPPGAAGTRATAPRAVDFKHAEAQAVAEFERTYLRQLLGSTRGNVSLASRLSKKAPSALNKLVKKHGIKTEEFRGA